MTRKTLLMTAIGLAGLIAANAVQANDRYSVSIGINIPAAPVRHVEYYEPPVYYVNPAPVVVYRPAPVYVAPSSVHIWGRSEHRGWDDRHHWREREHKHRHKHHGHGRHHGRHHGWD